MGMINVLPDLLSLDITAGLVAQGIRAPWRGGATLYDPPIFELDVLDASNTSPIVVTLPAGGLASEGVGVRPGTILHVVISGVEGNTAANKTDPLTLRSEAWHAVVTSSTTLALYELDNSTGAPIASAGNGAYTGGGTCSKALVRARVLLGVEEVMDVPAGPRIVMVPRTIGHNPHDVGSSWDSSARADGEHARERLNPAKRSIQYSYLVMVWGKSFAPVDQEIGRRSLGVTEDIHKQVIRSAHKVTHGSYELRGGDWHSQAEGALERIKHGQELAFELVFGTPVQEEAPTTVELSPSDVTTLVELSMTVDGGQPEEP